MKSAAVHNPEEEKLAAGASDFLWTAPDGTRFPARQWKPAGQVLAQVLCVHGLGGSVSDFNPLGERLAADGVCSLAVTVRGEGLDPDQKRRGNFMDPEIIGNDFALVLEQIKTRRPGVPVFLCGESLGGLLCAFWLAREQVGGVAGAIFSAPVVALTKKTPAIVRWGLRVLSILCPGGRLRPSWFVTGKSKPLPTSRDEAWLEAQRVGPQHISAFSFRALDATGRLISEMDAVAEGVHVPSLVLAAGKDVFVRTEQIRAWFDKLQAPDKTLLTYPEAYHVLWNDLDREAVLEDISDWISSRSGQSA